jgi:hypothetical protein
MSTTCSSDLVNPSPIPTVSTRSGSLSHIGHSKFLILDDLIQIIRLYLYYIQPITSHLYPECGGDALDSHKAFVVKYKMDEDLDLSFHYDNAEVTINVALGKQFSGGELYFGTFLLYCTHVNNVFL